MSTVGQCKPQGRSRITNGAASGRAVLPGIDGRSTYARRLRDVWWAHVEDLGGPDNISEAERSLLRRAAILTCEAEVMEYTFASQADPDPMLLDTYQRVASSLRRILESVGLKRRAKDITPPDPLIYAQRAAIEAEEAEVAE